jgi:hypothetical protein
MKNAHLRLTQVEYSVQSKNWSTRVEVWCDRLATEDNATHMLSIFGNDSEMAAVSGAISTNSKLTAKLPDGQRLELFMGEKPTTYRGHLSIPGHKRPVRHVLCFSEALMQNGANGSVTVLHNDDMLIWATVISFLGLPALPEWAVPGVQMFRNTEKIREIIGFNCTPVTVTITREELLKWIGSQVAEKMLFLPELAGPVIWPLYGIKDLLSASVVDEDIAGIAA